MRLVHPLLSSPIHFTEQSIPIWIIEQPTAFRQVAFDLMTQEEGGDGETVLSMRFDLLEGKDHLHIIHDFYHLKPSGKKLTTVFQSVLQRTVQEDLQLETFALNQAITEYLGKLSATLAQSTSFADEDFLSPLLKAIHFQLHIEEAAPIDRLIQYIELYHSLLKNQCFVLVNAKSYFSSDELASLYKIALYQKWRLLLLESSQHDERQAVEEYFLIDRDFCELRLD